MLKLSPDSLHIYYVFQDEINDENLLDRYRALLSDHELKQHKRLIYEKDRHRFLVTRALTRTVLSKYSKLAPQTWTFSTNMFGRPEIINNNAFPCPLSFNISHTNDLILIGIAQRPIGIDVENMTITRSCIQISRRYFSPVESDYMFSLPVERRDECFFHYWTLKEAYIKARGRGLSLSLRQFSFSFSGSRGIRVNFDPGLNDNYEDWHFCLLRPTDKHIAAIAVNYPAKLPVVVKTEKIVPLLSETTTAWPVLRETGN